MRSIGWRKRYVERGCGWGSRVAGFQPRLERLEDRCFLSGLPVANTFAVTNTADSGGGSLRQALIDAGNSPAPDGQVDLIQFTIGGSGTQVINLASALPVIGGPLTIDGTSQPGYAAAPLIEIDGAGAGTGIDGLHFTAADCTVEGLSIVGFSGSGIHFDTSTVGGDLVAGNFIGLTPAGAALANAIGVNVAVPNVTIGGTTAAARNVISGNSGDGILISGGSGDVVEGNFIGTNPAGNRAVANGAAGLDLENASAVTIGGTAAGAGNVISGNIYHGILLAGNQTGNLIEGNRIGTDLTGTLAVGNGGDGITLENSAGNTIGGTTAAARNIISGNGRLIHNSAGINISGNSPGNLIEGNYIGVDATDQISIKSVGSGVLINGSSGVTIGGTAAGAGNVITGNQGDGVSIIGSTAAANVVQGNFIGTTPGGAILGNQFHGVYIANGANNNEIGGTASGAGNLIDFNGGDGVLIGNDPLVAGSTPAGAGNAVEGNSIYANAQIGIDLGSGDGPTLNDSAGHAGPNDFQNFPVLTSAAGQNGPATVTGTLASAPNSTYRIDLFSTDWPDPTGFGQAETFVGAVSVTTDGLGNATFTTNVNLPQGQNYVTATSTDANGNTSEFSLTIASTAGAAPPGLRDLSVNSADEGSASFVLTANGTGFASGATIDFNGAALVTTFVSDSQLQATVPTSDLAEECTTSVTVVGPQGSSGSLPFTVTDPSVVGSGATITAVEGSDSGIQTVATFTDPGGVESLADYSAVINWDDGTKATGTISESNGTFAVSSNHTFAEQGTYTLFVTITHDDSPPITVTSSAIASDPAVVATGGFSLTAAQGSDSGSQTVATFTDPGGAEAVGDYSATIDWGDGSAATAGDISFANGTCTVSGDHAFNSAGTFAITVTVAHESAPAAIATSSAVVSPTTPVRASGGFWVRDVEGQDSGSQTVATFRASGGVTDPALFNALIAWGDGSSSAGSISFAAGVFTVKGSHGYAEEGYYAVNTTIQIGNAAVGAATSHARVSDPAVISTGDFVVNAVENSASGNQTVATFVDPGGAEDVSDYSATVHWGDGSSSAGTICFAGGVFTVQGNHTYLREGQFTIRVAIFHDNAPRAVAFSAAVVSDAPWSIGQVSGPTTPQPVRSPIQLSALLDDPGGSHDRHHAVWDWGDGSTSRGAITAPDANGDGLVSAHHRYRAAGIYTVTLSVRDDDGIVHTATFQLAIGKPVVAVATTTATSGTPAGVEPLLPSAAHASFFHALGVAALRSGR